ncbi:hypothetical protein F5B22DRAFT_650329 [Xylaria bambusicola]|uniref:uncharacterized protein n=1 Tax=Xylaria bambusicola TaxID=326684 RepID=UPI002008C1DE|nr:uncharacterized protein F5B22DRAFT_650329 [Xylaria bambusicola]KAI0506846.1 hypothetical protein F5B22DRAFT_650329 [Xylaria bambusicola]
MFAIILILSGLSFWLTKLRGMLPRNPCSIASVMALLADSRFMYSQDYMPPEAEWKNDDELAKHFDSYDVKLGWWDDDERYRFGIDIGEPVYLGFQGGKVGKQD